MRKMRPRESANGRLRMDEVCRCRRHPPTTQEGLVLSIFERKPISSPQKFILTRLVLSIIEREPSSSSQKFLLTNHLVKEDSGSHSGKFRTGRKTDTPEAD